MTDAGSVVTVPKFLPTGLPNIDDMLGGGIPAGRITELFSKGEGMGKSSLAARLMAEMQSRGGTVVLMDTEHGFTEQRLREFGVNPDKVVWVEPQHIEGGCQIIDSTLKYLKKHPEKGDKVLIVWDSIAASPSKAEYEADYGEIQVASGARAWSVNIKKLKDAIAKSECYVVMINQTRTNIGVMFGEKQTSTGGIAIKYYAGCRLVLYRGKGSWLKTGTVRKGFLVTMEMEKSRLAAPFQKAVVPLIFDTGWDRWKSLFDLLLKIEWITQKGAYYEMEGADKSFQQKGFPAAFKAMDKPDRERLIKKLEERYIDRATIEEFFE
jgi:recombination protein RecA